MVTTERKAIEAIKKQRPEKSKQYDLQVEPGDNTKYLSHSLEIYSLPDIDTHDPDQVNRRTSEYLSICIKNDMKPSIAGYALSLNMSRANLFDILTGRTRRPREVLDTLKRTATLINAQMEDYMQNGKINPASGIFLMKNNMGYRDETEVVLSPKEDKKSVEELEMEAEMLPE